MKDDVAGGAVVSYSNGCLALGVPIGAKLLPLLEFQPFDRARQRLRLEKLLSDFQSFRKRHYESI
jgi:hypothetical protein